MSLAACISLFLIVASIIMVFVNYRQFKVTRDSAFVCFGIAFLSVAVFLLVALMHFNPPF